MKKFMLVPEDLYNNLITKTTTIDDFSEQLLASAIRDPSKTPSQRHAVYNQRLPGYLAYKNRKMNRPMRVVLENQNQPSYPRSFKRKHQKPSLNFVTARDDNRETKALRVRRLEEDGNVDQDGQEDDGEDGTEEEVEDEEFDDIEDDEEEEDERLEETFVVSPHARFVPRSQRQVLKRDSMEDSPVLYEEKDKPYSPTIWKSEEHRGKTPRRPRSGETAKPRALAFLDEADEQHKEPGAMTREEAYKMLRTTIMKNKKAFRITNDGKVLSFTNLPVQGSHFDNILQKYRNKSLENVRGDKQFKEILLSNPVTAEVAKQFFTRSPMILKSGKILGQKGKGVIATTRNNSKRKTSRFTIRDWRRL